MFYNFFLTSINNYFEPIQYLYANNALILFKKYNFSVFNRAPSHTESLFQLNILLFFFNVHKTFFLYQFQNFISTIHRCCHKILFFSVKYFRICISKSFTRPRFFYNPFSQCTICAILSKKNAFSPEEEKQSKNCFSF